jgi:peptide-methionine (S)-S-oxide reductase
MLRHFTTALVLSAAIHCGSAAAGEAGLETAIFAGGCFWCVESDFDHVKGVSETISGYIGGEGDDPTYETYTDMGYREAVKITFDPSVVSFQTLVEGFFRSVDPTDSGGQFCDRGHGYTTAVYATSAEQKEIAEAARAGAEAELGRTVVTPVETAGTFYPAEAYHQDYYRNNPVRYRFYRANCGRDIRVTRIWGNSAWRGLGY